MRAGRLPLERIDGGRAAPGDLFRWDGNRVVPITLADVIVAGGLCQSTVGPGLPTLAGRNVGDFHRDRNTGILYEADLVTATFSDDFSGTGNVVGSATNGGTTAYTWAAHPGQQSPTRTSGHARYQSGGNPTTSGAGLSVGVGDKTLAVLNNSTNGAGQFVAQMGSSAGSEVLWLRYSGGNVRAAKNGGTLLSVNGYFGAGMTLGIDVVGTAVTFKVNGATFTTTTLTSSEQAALSYVGFQVNSDDNPGVDSVSGTLANVLSWVEAVPSARAAAYSSFGG